MEEYLNKVLRTIEERWNRYFEEVRNFLRMPSISATGEGIRETAEFLRDWLRERIGADATLLNYGGHPIVYGRIRGRSDKALILYNMYDVQPVEPLDKWIAPPFEARVINDVVIARGAVNTKAPLMSMLLGIEAVKDVMGDLPLSLIFVFEGEEELGSPSMPKFINDKGDELKGADGALFVIATEDVKGKPQVILGNRGIIYLELRIKTSEYDVHSSLVQFHHNPIEIAANLIASLKDKDGNIVAPWLYEDVVTPFDYDLQYLNDLMESADVHELMRTHGIRELRSDDLRELYIETYFKPSINVDGIIGGHVGPGTKTITPAEVMLKLDIRLVPNQDPDKVIKRFMEHLEKLKLSKWVEVSIHDKYPWSRTHPDSRPAKVAINSYRLLGMRPYVITTIAGSAPAYLFTQRLGIPFVSAGPGFGGRAHAPNEFIEVEGIKQLIKYTATYLMTYGVSQ